MRPGRKTTLHQIDVRRFKGGPWVPYQIWAAPYRQAVRRAREACKAECFSGFRVRVGDEVVAEAHQMGPGGNFRWSVGIWM